MCDQGTSYVVGQLIPFQPAKNFLLCELKRVDSYVNLYITSRLFVVNDFVIF